MNFPISENLYNSTKLHHKKVSLRFGNDITPNHIPNYSLPDKMSEINTYFSQS